MKQKKVSNGPCYKKELRIYERETLEKIEGFRRARAHWLATADESQKTFTNVKERMDESNIYKGRCICLRKIRLKTTLLRFHYKTLKPLKFYTFRKKLAEYEYYEEKSEAETDKKKADKKTEVDETCTGGQVWTKQAQDECESQARRLVGRRAQKKKMKECKAQKASGPCRKAIKRLKAAKIREGLIESCRCEDGREVTVVIKGICLCDKTSLNNLNLDKVCDEYSKMKKPEISYKKPIQQAVGDAGKQTKETNTSKTSQENVQNLDGKTVHAIDSIEVPKKVEPLHKVRGKRRKDEAIEDKKPTKSPDEQKKLTFENEENLKGDGGSRRKYNTGSDLTLFPKYSSEESVTADSDEEQKKLQRSTSLEAIKKPEKKGKTGEPGEVPQSESLNNLLVAEDSDTQTRGDKKRYVTPKKRLSDEELNQPHLSNSLIIHKKHLEKRASIKEQAAKTQSKENVVVKGDHEKHTERKTKVKLNDRPTVIPPRTFAAENSKPAHLPVEKHDMVTSQKSRTENEKANRLEKQSEATVSSRQDSGIKQDSENTSIVTLYKNRPEEKSNLALTEEEFKKMKEVEKEKRINTAENFANSPS